MTGYQVEGDASRDTLLIGSSGIDKFVVNGIDSTHGHDMWLYGADFQAAGTNNPSDNLTLKFKEAGFLQNITDEDGTLKDDFAVDMNGGFTGAGGLVHVDITLGTSGNTATKATITMRDGSVNETSLSLFFADGGNVDSTCLNKIKWES